MNWIWGNRRAGRAVPHLYQATGRWSMAIVAIALCLGVAPSAAKKKNPDDVTQTREIPKDPPQVAIGETRRLVFHVSPLSGKGLLTQQTRDALRALLRLNGGLPVVHLRAFVAGSGDVRRVPQIVSEILGEKKMPLPSVSVVRAGGLPMENAQVVIEATSVAKRDLNTAGLDFAVGDSATSPDPTAPTGPLLRDELDRLARKVDASSALMVSCFVSTLNNSADLISDISRRFPAAAVNLVQTQRSPYHALSICEAVARGSAVGAERLAFSGTRVAFGAGEKDASLAFQRLDRDLNEAGATPANVVLTHLYPLSTPVSEMARRLRPTAAPIAVIPFEGLAAIDAGFAIDAVAAVAR